MKKCEICGGGGHGGESFDNYYTICLTCYRKGYKFRWFKDEKFLQVVSKYGKIIKKIKLR